MSLLAEGAGFEPAEHDGSPVFKTGGLVRSPTPPRIIIHIALLFLTRLENEEQSSLSFDYPPTKKACPIIDDNNLARSNCSLWLIKVNGESFFIQKT